MESFGDIVLHVIGHSVADTLYLIPFLFITYVLMEWLEHRTGSKTQEAVRRAGAAGPVVGALLGVVPQCGFSAAAATLYAGRVITLGTLIAVFLSTSDEMLPIFIAEQVPLVVILKILVAKIIVGMVIGFIFDAVLRILRRDSPRFRIHELCKQDNCHCEGNCVTCAEHPELVYEHLEDAVQEREAARGESVADHDHSHDYNHYYNHDYNHDYNHGHSHDRALTRDDGHTHEDAPVHRHAHDHSHDHEGGWSVILKSAAIHTIQVTLFVFLITIALNALIEGVGEEALGDFIGSNPLLSILGASLLGLVPNCAASIAIADLYVEGVLGAGAMFGGLLTAAGVGLLVLFRSNRPVRESVYIVIALYVVGVLCGLSVDALGITF